MLTISTKKVAGNLKRVAILYSIMGKQILAWKQNKTLTYEDDKAKLSF